MIAHDFYLRMTFKNVKTKCMLLKMYEHIAHSVRPVRPDLVLVFNLPRDIYRAIIGKLHNTLF